jgi:hypothetical protein
MDQDYCEPVMAAGEDSPAEQCTMSQARGAKKTVAEVQYDMLASRPFEYMQEDVVFNSRLQRQDLGDLSDHETAELRREFFARLQPGLRASPPAKQYGWGLTLQYAWGLTLQYGWGLTLDADDKLALTPVGRTSTGRRWRKGSSSSSRSCARAASRKMKRSRREGAGVATR